MKDNVNNIYGTWNGDNIDNSTNIINNFYIRVNLQEREASGKTYEYTLFCLHEFKKAKNVPDGYIRITCINVHSDCMFVSDHIHIDFPKSLYDDYSYDYSVMTIKAKAYKYPKGKGFDYGLKVTKIESATNRLGHYTGSYGNKVLPKLESDQKEFFKFVYTISKDYDCLCEILSQQINYLEGIIANENRLYPGFLFNMIATYYFANDYKKELETKSFYLHELGRENILEMLQLFSKIIFKINNGEIFMWRQLLFEINEFCNVIQEIIKDVTKKNRYNKEVFNEVYDNIQHFAIKIYAEETKAMFDKIKRRNEDYGYQYPKNVEKYKEQLHDYVIWYLFNQKYFTSDMYYEEWKEDI